MGRGADDDGSGTTSSLEALRALAAAKFTPATPVEFHYFSAEEGGLLGSQAIAKNYEDKGIKVKAMLQMDMTAWVKEGTTESVGIIQDFVDPDLTAFLEGLVGEYREFAFVTHHCKLKISRHPCGKDEMWLRLFGSLELQQSRLPVLLRVSLLGDLMATTNMQY